MTVHINIEELTTPGGRARIFSDLAYISYASNRDQGMTAEGLARLFPETAAAMEDRYLADQFEEAGRRG